MSPRKGNNFILPICLSTCLISGFSLSECSAEVNGYLVGFFKRAEEKNEQLAQLKIDAEINEQEKQVATSSFLPTLSIYDVTKVADESSKNKAGTRELDNNAYVSLEQQIYHGGKEYTLLELVKIKSRYHILNQKNARLTLYAALSSVYFNLWQVREESSIIQTQLAVQEKRIDSIKKRAEIGRSRRSDYLVAIAHKNKLRSEELRVKGRISEQLEQMRVLVPDFKLSEIPDGRPVLLGERFGNGGTALADKNDLLLARAEIELAENTVAIKQGDYLPTVDFYTNYYVDKSLVGKDDWEIGVKAGWKLWDFSARSSNLQVARLEKTQKELKFNEMLKKYTEKEIGLQERENLKRQEVAAMQQYYQEQKRAFKEQQREYENGLISYLDFSRAEEDLINGQRNENNVFFEWVLRREERAIFHEHIL